MRGGEAGDRQARAKDFLRIVQAGILTHAASIRQSDVNREPAKIAEYSGTGVFIRMDEAVRAAGLIPAAMSVAEAASAFCAYWLGPRNRDTLPMWFARSNFEEHDYNAVSKPDQFLWIVQTALLADAEHQAYAAARGEKAGGYDDSSVVRIMGEAVRVSVRTPSDLSATGAASEFVSHYVPGMKERATPPKWCRTT